MSAGSKISWTDATWNVVLGCSRVSAGCDSCYAIGQARMRSANPNPKIATAFAGLTERTDARIDWTGRVNLLEDRLDQPLHWRKPRRIFVNSLADLFHENVPATTIIEVFAVMALTPHHTYQVLTKRHARMRSLLSHPDFWTQVGRSARHRGYGKHQAANHLGDGRNIYDTATWDDLTELPNVWLGVSVEDQHWADIRIPVLLDTPAAVRWISAEPLLGPIILKPEWTEIELKAFGGNGAELFPRINWIVVGGESGHRARAIHPRWARSLRDQAVAAKIPFHFKQWGEWGPAPFVVRVCDPKVGWQGTDEELEAAKRDSEARGATHVHTDNQYRDDDGKLRYHLHEIGHKPWSMERGELGDDLYAPIRRWGTGVAGRVLDGRTWDEYPGEVADG